MRVESPKPSKNGGWIHFFDDLPPRPMAAVKREVKKEIVSDVSRSVADIDTVYRAFLDNLVLSYAHETELRRRGLNLLGILLGGYKSMPSKLFAQAVCKRLTKQGLDLRGVPGFYRDRFGNHHFVDYKNATGFLIPIKNELGQIRALQLRRDDDRKPKYLMMSSAAYKGGTSSHTPFHVNRNYPQKNKLFTEVIITEGILKANIIAEILRVPVVGLVSAAAFSDSFAYELQKAFPNLRKAFIAFDMDKFDPEKPDTCAFAHVGRQRERLIALLEKNNLRVALKVWEGGYKGYDDFLNASKNYANAA